MIITLNYQPSGGKTWVAEITGRDPKYTFARDFIPHIAKNTSSSGKTGEVKFELKAGKIYEVNEAWNGRYFINGEGVRMSAEQVLDFLDGIEPAPPVKILPDIF